jgi:hypothetical protein
MRKFALDLYQSMVEELKLLQMDDQVTEQSIECCYQLSSNYWLRLTQMVSRYHFHSEEEEIDFFKRVNPLFTSEIEYYKLLFHATIFTPPDDLEARKFWQREFLRLDRFVENHLDFVQYMLTGNTCHDKDYFLRKNFDRSNQANFGIDLAEKDAYTNSDGLLAEFLSLQKYIVYIQTYLNQNPLTNGKL